MATNDPSLKTMFKLFRKSDTEFAKTIAELTQSRESYKTPQTLVKLMKNNELALNECFRNRLTDVLPSLNQKLLTVILWEFCLLNGTKKLRALFVNNARGLIQELDQQDTVMLLDRFYAVVQEVAQHYNDDKDLEKLAKDCSLASSERSRYQQSDALLVAPDSPQMQTEMPIFPDLSTKQISAHIKVTTEAIEMFIEALNFNEVSISENVLIQELYSQLVTFKDANDRWIQNCRNESMTVVLLQYSDRILEAIRLYHLMKSSDYIMPKNQKALNRLSVAVSSTDVFSGAVDEQDLQEVFRGIPEIDEPRFHLDILIEEEEEEPIKIEREPSFKKKRGILNNGMTLKPILAGNNQREQIQGGGLYATSALSVLSDLELESPYLEPSFADLTITVDPDQEQPKSFFFHSPPPEWSNLTVLQNSMTQTLELLELSQDIQSNDSQIQPHGQEIHDLCQYVLFTYSSAVSTCIDLEIKQKCQWDMDQLEALRGVLKMLVKRNAKDGIISCAYEVGQIFEDLIKALMALQLIKA